jgi:hypothetical protein
MRQVQDALLRRITRAIHNQFQEIAHEPLPRRWVDLIHHLDAQERKGPERPEAVTEPSTSEDRQAASERTALMAVDIGEST